jgi:hypothetical protein
MSELPDYLRPKNPTLRTGDVCDGCVIKRPGEQENKKIAVVKDPEHLRKTEPGDERTK